MNTRANPPTEAVSGSGLPIDMAQPDAAVTEMPPATRAVIALKSSKTELDMRAMVAKHAGLIEIKDKAGREQVHSAAMELMRARTSIKKVADEVRDDAKKFNAAVIAEEKRLTAIVEPEELRLKGLRDAWDAEQERIKREAEEKERQRVLALGARIQEIRGFARLAQDCRSSDAVRRLVDRLDGLDMTGFEEFEREAMTAFQETRQAVQATLYAKLDSEAEAARIKAEREELARQQAEAQRKADELAAQQKAEAERLAAERAEIDRMRAELEVAKAPKPEPFPVDGQIVAGKKLREALEAAGATLADVVVADADLVDTVSMQDDGTSSVPDAGVPWDIAAESAEARLGFDMAMSMPVATTPRAAVLVDDTPPAASLIGAIATAYGVDNETACHWLCVRADDFLEWVEPTATPA